MNPDEQISSNSPTPAFKEEFEVEERISSTNEAIAKIKLYLLFLRVRNAPIRKEIIPKPNRRITSRYWILKLSNKSIKEAVFASKSGQNSIIIANMIGNEAERILF